MKPRVHPRIKTTHRVGQLAWTTTQALVRRGDLTLWISARRGRHGGSRHPRAERGAQPRFSDLAIETALTLRLIFNLPLRQTEGFVRSILSLLDWDLDAPDHTTLSRRGRDLDIDLHRLRAPGPIHLVVDSTGLSIVGEGEWASIKHGGSGKRGWRELRLGVDSRGWIVAAELTSGDADDAVVAPGLLDQVEGTIARFTTDSAYDSSAVYSAAESRGAAVVIPPRKPAIARRARRRLKGSRDATIARVQQVGLRRWKKDAGYHQQSRVENAFFRLKQAIGGRLRARGSQAQWVEAMLACSVMNRFAVRAISIIDGPLITLLDVLCWGSAPDPEVFEAWLRSPMDACGGTEKRPPVPEATGGLMQPSAHRRPGYPLAGCTSAEPTSVSPGKFMSRVGGGDHAQPLASERVPPMPASRRPRRRAFHRSG
jgi:hypothetical protein